MHIIVDTNVLVVAAKKPPQASPQCIINCVHKLQEIEKHQILVIDNKWRILQEYQRQFYRDGQPTVKSEFLEWVLKNRNNPQRCEQVSITELSPNEFQEFPVDSALTGFDPSDRKFVAVALAHPAHPPIVNAVDSDWHDFENALLAHGLKIDFLCPDVLSSNLASSFSP